MDDDRMKCPYCDGMLSGHYYKPTEEGILIKYIFCPDCGFERPAEESE